MLKPLNLTRTRAALAAYEVSQSRRADNWARAATRRAVARCGAADAAALAFVREAFYLDTSDRNTREQAFTADLWFIRELCASQERASC